MRPAHQFRRLPGLYGGKRRRHARIFFPEAGEDRQGPGDRFHAAVRRLLHLSLYLVEPAASYLYRRRLLDGGGHRLPRGAVEAAQGRYGADSFFVIEQIFYMPGPGAYWFGKEEMDAVIQVMESGHLFRYGSEDDPRFLHMVANLEKEFAAYSGARFALATCSGTASLVAALAALGLKAGDEVLVPAYTFVASYTAILFMGLVPVLCEVDDSLTLDPGDLPSRLTPRTRAIMPVHMLGNPCDMERIMAFARAHGLLVIEDCCQAAGATYRGRKV